VITSDGGFIPIPTCKNNTGAETTMALDNQRLRRVESRCVSNIFSFSW